MHAGGAISVAIYDDRLEIWSDGTLPFGLKPEDLKRKHESRPRNQFIAGFFYRRGLMHLDAYCRKTHNAPFARLSPAQQHEVVAAIEQGKDTGFTWPSAQVFFNTVRNHTMEGMFADQRESREFGFVG